jgi:cytochrome c553
MPHVQLEETEAADIAGYILGFEESDGKTAAGIGAIAPDPLLAKRGQELVKSARCAACHELPKELANERFVVRDAEAGCLKDGSTREVPRYRLTQNQRAALSMYLADRNHVLTAPEKAQLILKTLNCCACHERDGTGGPDAFHRPYFVGDHNLGDTGRYPPPLTGVGGKLQPDWLEAVLQGGNRVRSYLKTRMPVYGGATEGLALLLERTDSGTKHTLPGGDDAAGRKLLGTQGGIGCITCHRWGEHAALGIQALDLSNLGQRLKPEWLLEYLIDPAAYRPGTLMPSFWPGGKSSNLMILQGDTSRQIASIYSFAKSANGEPEGFREFKNGQFELLPKEKPIIQRTFLKDVGTHAILVGFPTGVHLAVDGKSGQPALVWKGRFFDASTTWFSRFAPFENPLGENVLKWSAVTSSGQQRRFDGYRLDAKGSPIFLYSISGVSVEDHFEGVENGIERSISWPPDASEPPVTHPDAMTVREEPTDGRGQRRFTYFWK